MKVVTLHHPHSFTKKDFPPLSIALGFFDGVHRGHQKVIQQAVQTAQKQQWTSAVMTFDPHPSVVLGKEKKHVRYITPLKDKIELIASLGVDYLFIVRFTSFFSSLSPQHFVDQYLVDLHVKHVTAGFDYTYGKYGKGTMETMETFADGRFTYSVVEKLSESGEKVSSTKIREQLKDGDFPTVTNLLGRFYTMKGTVVHGEKRGRKIGFRTANIHLNHDYLIPKMGVYAVRFFVNHQWFEGVCNVGYNLTFTHPDAYALSIEVHILDFSDDIYGEEVVVEWHQRFRAELKFNHVDELIAQMEKDKQQALDYFRKKRL